MPYTPPNHDAVNINFKVGYTPPAHDAANVYFAPSADAGLAAAVGNATANFAGVEEFAGPINATLGNATANIAARQGQQMRIVFAIGS